jgi:tRNA threonylcarbamoyladenosine biosynthesis protein TsaE
MKIDETPDALIVHLHDEHDTDRLGRAIASVVSPGTVIGLVGPLGAGKSRITRAIAEALGVDPLAVSSPTFVLIHEYEGHLPVYHLDAYRLGGPAAFEALGVADYWEAGGVCLVEWADRVAEVLPERAWWLRIEPAGGTVRRVLIQTTCQAGLVRAIEKTTEDL